MAVDIHKADKPLSENVIQQDIKVTYKSTFLYHHQLSLILQNGQMGEELVELKAPEVRTNLTFSQQCCTIMVADVSN
jgi:hypothetical protein